MTAIAVANFPDFKLILVDCKILKARKKFVWQEDIMNKLVPLGDSGFCCIGDGVFFSHTAECDKSKKDKGLILDYKSHTSIDEYLQFIIGKRNELDRKLVEVDKFEESELPPLTKTHLFFIDKNGIYSWRTMVDHTKREYIRWQQAVRTVPENTIEIYYDDNYYSMHTGGITEENIVESIAFKLEEIHNTIPKSGKLRYEFEGKFSFVFIKPHGGAYSDKIGF